MHKLEEGWLTVLLLCAMIVVAAGGVAAAGWADGLNAAWITGIVAVLAGLALARSRFAGSTVFLFATVYGLFTVGFFVALGLEGDWHARSVEIVVRLNAFIYKALHGGTSRDALPFPVSVALIFWYIGVLMSWSVFRRGSVWPAIIPAGVGLLVNAYYYLGPARLDLYLAVYVLLALMFVARMNLLAREREWQIARVNYSTDLRLDFLRAGLVAALAGVLIGWAAPGLAASPEAATAWRQATGSFRVVRESWMRMFAAIRGYGQAYSDFYGNALVLGGPARLSAEPIMDVAVTDLTPEDEVIGDEPPPIPRLYWRANILSQYDQGEWSVGEVVYREFDPEDTTRLNIVPYRQRRRVALAVTMHVAASSLLYTAPHIEWVDRLTTLDVSYDPLNAGPVDVTAVRAQQVLRRGEVYQLVASVSVADQESLREAGTSYPEWVRANYLQVPPEITQRTRDLARQIVEAAGAETPYDMAEAITQWLRTNITYDQNIEAPPPDVEPHDYFLFETRRGYCNYYATAEVVLLRAVGIPARVAVGMAQGQQDPNTGVYHVLEQNAHAWPEVFFPGYGWVEFEPTTSEAPIVRPERPVTTESETTADDFDPEEGFERGFDDNGIMPDDFFTDEQSPTTEADLLLLRVRAWLNRIPWVGLALTGGVALVLMTAAGVASLRAGVLGWESFGKVGTWIMQRRGVRLPSSVALVYMQFERAARWLGVGSSQAVTPHERAAAFGEAMPEARPSIETLTGEYVAEQYSPRPADPGQAQRAWHGIRFQVWHDALRAYLLDLLEEDDRRPR